MGPKGLSKSGVLSRYTISHFSTSIGNYVTHHPTGGDYVNEANK